MGYRSKLQLLFIFYIRFIKQGITTCRIVLYRFRFHQLEGGVFYRAYEAYTGAVIQRLDIACKMRNSKQQQNYCRNSDLQLFGTYLGFVKQKTAYEIVM